MGPGILMASAAVGGSHIVSSTQAGGSYGWSLLLLVILANVLNIHFSVLVQNIPADTGKTLVEGYAEKASSISGFSLSSMSSLLWSIQLESLSFAQPSSLALFQWLVLASLNGPLSLLQSFGPCYSLVATNYWTVWQNGLCPLWPLQQFLQLSLQQLSIQNTALILSKRHLGKWRPSLSSFPS